MADDHPPLYPFPSDENVVWPRGLPDNWNPDGDSYFGLAILDEPDVREFDGVEHINPYRLVIRTPLRGSQSVMTNIGDWSSFMAMALLAMAHDDSGMYGDPDDSEQVVFSPSYWEHMTGLDIEVFSDD